MTCFSLFRPVNMTKGPPLRQILIFAAPLFVGNVFQQLYNVVDSAVVGNYVGPNALAAVGLCFPILLFIYSLFFGLGTGASVLVSHYRGAADAGGVHRTVATAYGLLFTGAVPLTLMGYLLTPLVLRLIHVPDDIIEQSTLYMRIYFMGSVASLGFHINDGVLRGLGDSMSSLCFLAVACFVNVSLDLLFVLVFGWGVAGVAVATLIAQLVAWLLSTWYLHHRYWEGHCFAVRLERAVLQKLLRISLPASLQQAVFSLGIIVIQALINGYGIFFIAGFNAASKIDSFAFMPLQSFATAASAFVGQNTGAGQPLRIQQGVHKVLKVSLLTDAILVAAILFGGRALMGFFNQDSEVISAGMAYLWRILPFYFILTVTSLLSAVMRGAGCVGVPTLIMFLSLWMGRVPAAYLLARYFGPENLFFCYGVGWIIEILLSGAYYLSGKWKRNITENTSEGAERP